MAEPIVIPARIRICKRCGHEECPFCRTWCDNLECVCFDEPYEGQCDYGDEEPDVDGYDRLDQALDEATEAGHGVGVRASEDRKAWVVDPPEAPISGPPSP